MNENQNCIKCGHLGYHHRPECTYIELSDVVSFIATKTSCDCQEFITEKGK